MNLAQISWPVFRLGEHRPQTVDGVTFYSKTRIDLETGKTTVSFRIVDDVKNYPSEIGLGRRRLLIKQNNPQLKLFNIRSAIYFISDLIKLAKPTTWFIDNNGIVFNYRKTTRAKLDFYKIKKIIPGKQTGVIIEVEGLATRFKCMWPPQNGEEYVGILKWGLGYLLYGFYDKKHKSTYRLL